MVGMVRIQDLLKRKEEELFVGRGRELALLRDELAADNECWRLVHVHGPSGIGKTSLLRGLARDLEIAAVTLNGEDCRSADQFLAQLRARLIEQGCPLPADEADEAAAMLADYLNEAAGERQRMIIFLDDFDACRSIWAWLRDHWLPMLSVRVRVCTTGRYPLEEEWRRSPGWDGLVRNLRLEPLHRHAVDRYAFARGIRERVSRDAIAQFAKGMPIALTLASDALLQHGPDAIREGEVKRRMLQSLCGILQADLQDHCEWRLLEAASLFWRFDQELLEEVSGQRLSDEAFRKLCGLSFVDLSEEGGWRVADAAREWIRSDWRSRMPDAYDAYRRRALPVLQARMAAAPMVLQGRLIAELLYVHDPELLRGYDSLGRYERVLKTKIRRASGADLTFTARLDREEDAAMTPRLLEDTEQMSGLRAIWEAESSYCSVLEIDDQPAAYYSWVPITPATRRLFEINPALRAYWTASPPQDQDVLFWVERTLPHLDPSAFGLLLRGLFQELAGQSILTFVSLPYYAELYASLGFRRLPSADARCADGTPMHAYRLDLREKNLFEPLAIQPPNAPPDSISPREAASLLKKALMNAHALESDPKLRQSLDQWEAIKRRRNLLDGSMASAVREAVTECLAKMSEGAEEERLQAQAIRLSYMHRIGTHEVVASRLCLSLSTYYRYLKKGFERVAHELIRA
ncbi:ATP-binding protein [Paenibacillus methanolicus]|uniref:AAA ATPase-like protein n=1 Tax=Paenibacillus methanolicus TaxID=582686 RepID=A0A5S5CAR9_9BACL|nr:ATP-binding protein [Paenibacillus methanolicus]TYP76505.1 AAA ATPase-like protein [Paenibacillus methanolicus]